MPVNFPNAGNSISYENQITLPMSRTGHRIRGSANAMRGEEASQSQFPFCVRLTQQYQYPGTELVSSAGMIEQVVNEDSDNYVLSTPTETTVKIPKSLVMRVSDGEAANGLIAERTTHTAQIQQAAAAVKQMAATVQQLQAEREQIMQAIQLIQLVIAVRQKQQQQPRGKWKRTVIFTLRGSRRAKQGGRCS